MIPILSLEDYIKKRKYEDKINEFDQKNKTENLKLSVGYVIHYYLKYLDENNVKKINNQHNEKLMKYKKQLKFYDAELGNWLFQIYDEYEAKLPLAVNHYLKNIEYYLLLYKEEEFIKLAKDYCRLNISRMPYLKGQTENVNKLIKSILRQKTQSEFHGRVLALLGATTSKWVLDTFNHYSVNLDEFASDYVSHFFDRYPLDFEYDYKQKDNLFDIDVLYDKIKDRPFIKGYKKELEKLLMYHWLFSIEGEEDYWKVYTDTELNIEG